MPAKPDATPQSTRLVNRQKQNHRNRSSPQFKKRTDNETSVLDNDSSSEDEIVFVRNPQSIVETQPCNISEQITPEETLSDETSDNGEVITPSEPEIAVTPEHDNAPLEIQPVFESPLEEISEGVPQIVQGTNPRPSRIRQPPDRLAYYAPGQAYLIHYVNRINSIPFVSNQTISVPHHIMQGAPRASLRPVYTFSPMHDVTAMCRQPIQNLMPSNMLWNRPVY